MARILLLTELLPYPLVSGAKIRAYYVLRYLSAKHQVTLLSFVRANDQPRYISHLKSFLHDVHTVPMQRSWVRNASAFVVSLATGCPTIIARENIRAMRAKVGQFLSSEPFDVIHADQIPMAQYGLMGDGTRVKRLLDQHNTTFQILFRLSAYETNPLIRLFMQREARAFMRYESAVCRRFEHVTFVTQEDQRTLWEQAGDSTDELVDRTTVIPICVDTTTVSLVKPAIAPFRVTHVGTMYWPPNVEGILWFWESVWPRVRDQVPGARLTLIGRNPPNSIRILGREPEVDVLGYVEDLTPYLSETAVFIVPLHAAGGMRVKILDAWCWGVPVASTSIGAEGIEVREGENILLADTPAVFAQVVGRLMRDANLRGRLRFNGRQWVEERYEWRRIYPAWDGVYQRLLQG